MFDVLSVREEKPEPEGELAIPLPTFLFIPVFLLHWPYCVSVSFDINGEILTCIYLKQINAFRLVGPDRSLSISVIIWTGSLCLYYLHHHRHPIFSLVLGGFNPQGYRRDVGCITLSIMERWDLFYKWRAWNGVSLVK